jgi:hypothetical protein
MTIPIVIICYNNYKYVDNTIKQLIKINPNYKKDIIIVDNASTCEETLIFLKNTEVKSIINNKNSGPWIRPNLNSHIWNLMPTEFILTDPDLEYNENTPSNLIEILSNISNKYKYGKVGLAIKIDDFDKMYQGIYYLGNTIYEWEKRFWIYKVPDTEYEMYFAELDTTFVLINKKYYNHDYTAIRVAGNFLARHIPWYVDNSIYTSTEILSKTTNISTMYNIYKEL